MIWIGGGAWPNGGREYNLSNDIHAANVVMKSSLEVWQVPRSTYRTMGVSYAELIEKMYTLGTNGKYLIDQLLAHNAQTRPEMEYRSLGDSPCIGLIMDPECGQWTWRPAPTFDQQMHYLHTGQYRPIHVYDNVRIPTSSTRTFSLSWRSSSAVDHGSSEEYCAEHAIHPSQVKSHQRGSHP